MVTVIKEETVGNKAFTVKQYAGLSTDDKPTDAKNGAMFLEMNTGDIYAYNEAGTTWVKLT